MPHLPRDGPCPRAAPLRAHVLFGVRAAPPLQRVCVPAAVLQGRVHHEAPGPAPRPGRRAGDRARELRARHVEEGTKGRRPRVPVEEGPQGEA